MNYWSPHNHYHNCIHVVEKGKTTNLLQKMFLKIQIPHNGLPKTWYKLFLKMLSHYLANNLSAVMILLDFCKTPSFGVKLDSKIPWLWLVVWSTTISLAIEYSKRIKSYSAISLWLKKAADSRMRPVEAISLGPWQLNVVISF